MSTELTPIIDKVRKLLRLGQSQNENEAAAAMAAANRLIQQYRLSVAQVEVETGVNAEAVMADPHAISMGKRPAKWKARLILALARHNGCKPLWKTSLGREKQYILIGRKSDVDTVKYMFGYAVSELTRLAPSGRGRIYRDSWFHGAVSGINAQLKDAELEEKKTASTQAIVKLDQRMTEAEAFMDANFETKKETLRSKSNMDWGAYERGKSTGKTLRLGTEKLLS